MHIIFGDTAKLMPDSFTILELDTVKLLPDTKLIPVWCVVETIPLGEFSEAAANQQLHIDLIANYRKRNWSYCLEAINHLTGKWNGEIDSFYTELADRVEQLSQVPQANDWDGTLIRNLTPA